MLQWGQIPPPNKMSIILELKGDLDTKGATILEPTLLKLCDVPEPNLILECSQLKYVDSRGLGLFIKGFKRRKELNKNIILVSLQDSIQHLFKILQLNQLFTIYDSMEKAIKFQD